MRRPNHASRFEGTAKTNLQASRASETETLQSQVTKAAKKRLSLSGLEVLHGRLRSFARPAQPSRVPPGLECWATSRCRLRDKSGSQHVGSHCIRLPAQQFRQ